MKGIINRCGRILVSLFLAIASIQVTASTESSRQCSASHRALLSDLVSVCSVLKTTHIEDLPEITPWLKSELTNINHNIGIVGECVENWKMENTVAASYVHYMYQNLVLPDIKLLLKHEEMPIIEVKKARFSVVVNLSGIVEGCSLNE